MSLLKKRGATSLIVTTVAFAVVVILGLWYMSYASKANIDRVLDQNAVQNALGG